MSNWPDWLPLRKDLESMSPYGAPQIDVPVRLNTNENPYSLSNEVQARLIDALSSALQNLNRYPDRDALELRSSLAGFINQQHGASFDFSHIWAANGSNEILQSLMLAFDGDYIGFEPSYSMHPLIAKTLGRSWRSFPRTSHFKIDLTAITSQIEGSGPGLVFVTTPNNPTGDSLSLDVIEKIAALAARERKLVVVDEAYAEFSSQDSAVCLVKKCNNIVVVRTMSKAFAFAGVRLGYLVAHPSVVESMSLVRLPYHLSALTQAASIAALGMQSEFLSHIEEIKAERELVRVGLEEMGLVPLHSDANFILFTGFSKSAEALWSGLVDKGVLIRDVGIPGYLRVTIGTRAENQQFLSALREFL